MRVLRTADRQGRLNRTDDVAESHQVRDIHMLNPIDSSRRKDGRHRGLDV